MLMYVFNPPTVNVLRSPTVILPLFVKSAGAEVRFTPFWMMNSPAFLAKFARALLPFWSRMLGAPEVPSSRILAALVTMSAEKPLLLKLRVPLRTS